MPVFLVLCVRSPVSSSMRLTTACHLPLFFLTDPLPQMRKVLLLSFSLPILLPKHFVIPDMHIYLRKLKSL